MTAQRRYRQLKLGVDALRDQYHAVPLSFRIGHHWVHGVLNGSCSDWTFESDSPSFLRQIPSGLLYKYALWYDRIPRNINKIYHGILESALKAGYDLYEKEEALS